LSADEAKQTQDCAGRGASSPACAQDAQKVSQDHQQVDQANQQVASAQLSAARDQTQAQAKIQSDDNQIQSAQANLASLEATEATSGGSYTWLPTVGDIITEDQAVYSVSNQRVPLLYGPVAAYRAFYLGMADGADVGELTHDLMVLGFGAGLSQTNHYSSATAAAVQRWQTALGLPATGGILLGQVVFEPGPIRVTAVTPSVGQSVAGGSGGGGTVLTATSTTPMVTVDLDVTQEYLVKPGDAVSVVLPDGVTTVGGRVESVGNVAICPGGGGSGTGNGSGVADQSPCQSSGSGNSSTPTVTMTVSLDRVPPGATLDQAPVNVNITTDRAEDVLAVPVNALLALAGGGFGVDVVTGSTTRLVGVTTGLYDNTLVQVSGAGLTAGMRVEVPSA
jgi:peptidoglycan hydrolase-like protein with peptidoglycan-binding domain